MIAQPVAIESDLQLPPAYNPKEFYWQTIMMILSCDLSHKICLDTSKNILSLKAWATVRDNQNSRWDWCKSHFSLFLFSITIFYRSEYE